MHVGRTIDRRARVECMGASLSIVATHRPGPSEVTKLGAESARSARRPTCVPAPLSPGPSGTQCAAPAPPAAAPVEAIDPELYDGSTPLGTLAGAKTGGTDITKMFFIGVAVLLSIPIAMALFLGKIGGGDFSVLVTIVLSLLLYFLPALVANQRRHRQGNAIFVLNFFLGWTVIGWIAALVWSFTK